MAARDHGLLSGSARDRRGRRRLSRDRASTARAPPQHERAHRSLRHLAPDVAHGGHGTRARRGDGGGEAARRERGRRNSHRRRRRPRRPIGAVR